MAIHKLVMLRHGDSEWNKDNKFCGWYDADLSDIGVEEAKSAGKMLLESDLKFDVAFTSVLKRAIKTLFHIQDVLDNHWIPVVKSWRLNERMYGALQGFNKSETAAKHGEKQVKIWRRAYDIPPPVLDENDERWPIHDPKYKHIDKALIPRSECLKDTKARVLPFWYDVVVPEILRGKKVLLVIHGTSVRALVKHLDHVSDEDIMGVDIPTGIPLVYELDSELKPIKHYYLADDAVVKAAQAKIAAQGKIKSADT